MIHHIFIFSGHNGEEADELIQNGFKEGSQRVHDGQGTANRSFYFRNFYLEILWVNRLSDFKRDKVIQTGLWQRSQHRNNNMSPFGLCLENTDHTDALFQDCMLYQPDYLPEGKQIEIVPNDTFPGLPWTFRLPKSIETNKPVEPGPHIIDSRELTAVLIEGHQPDGNSVWMDYFEKHDMIRFRPAPENRMTLIFDHHRHGKSMKFDTLPLSIQY
jgi:hypothetical protein